MPNCCASNCFHRHDQGFRLFRFPSNAERRAIWIERSRPRKLTPHSRLCEYHFHDSCFENKRADGIRKLKWNALPTIFSDMNIIGEPTMPIPPKPVEEVKIYKENVNLYFNNLNKPKSITFSSNNHLEEEQSPPPLVNVINEEKKKVFISLGLSQRKFHVLSVETPIADQQDHSNSPDASATEELGNVRVVGEIVGTYLEIQDEAPLDQAGHFENEKNQESPSPSQDESEKFNEPIFLDSGNDDDCVTDYEYLSDSELIDKQEQDLEKIERKIDGNAEGGDDEDMTRRLDTTFFPTDSGTICQANEIKRLRSQLALAHKKIDVIVKQKKELQARLKEKAPMQRKWNGRMKNLMKRRQIFSSFVDNVDAKSNWTEDCVELATKIRYSIGLQAYLKLKNDVGIPLPSHATICRFVKKRKRIGPGGDGPAGKVLRIVDCDKKKNTHFCV